MELGTTLARGGTLMAHSFPYIESHCNEMGQRPVLEDSGGSAGHDVGIIHAPCQNTQGPPASPGFFGLVFTLLEGTQRKRNLACLTPSLRGDINLDPKLQCQPEM